MFFTKIEIEEADILKADISSTIFYLYNSKIHPCFVLQDKWRLQFVEIKHSSGNTEVEASRWKDRR